MLGVEAAVFPEVHVAHGVADGVHHGSGGDAASVPLLPSFRDANRLGTVRLASGAKLGANQPQGLAEEGEQQESGEKLRTSEAVASEIWAH